MKKIAFLLLFAIHHRCVGQILNSSFENWEFNPNADNASQKWILKDWYHCDQQGAAIPDPIISLFGTYKDSSAHSGSSALTLSRWYNYTFDVAKFKNSCVVKPSHLNGFYKYSESLLSIGIPDTARISVFLTKFNNNTQIMDTIGVGRLDLAATGSYTYFQCPIQYVPQSPLPDSIIIYIQPTKFEFGVGGCSLDSWCSFLSIDDLSLSMSTSTADIQESSAFQVFPNPASAYIVVEGDIMNQKVRINNALGKVVFTQTVRSNAAIIDTAGLVPGVYIISVSGQGKKFIVE